MPDAEWLATLASSLPRYFNSLSGRCTLVLSDCVVECSKSVLSAQSPVLEEYFMSSERDINRIIAERRAAFLAKGDNIETSHAGDGHDDNPDVDDDDEDDDTSVIVLTDYYGFDDIVSSFFRSFYTGEITINPETYHVTLKLACKYEVAWIITKCCSFLETFLNEQNFFQHFRFLMVFQEDRITNLVLAKLRGLNYESLIDHTNINSELQKIDIDQLVAVLNNLQPPTELHMAHLALSWLEHDLPSRKSKFLSIISNLRLINVPQSFTNDVVLKYVEDRQMESTQLWKIVLGAQTFFFARNMGRSPKNKTQEQFPNVFESRSSYLESEEYEFKISFKNLKKGKFKDKNVKLVYESELDKFYFCFKRRCCFVYFTNEDLVKSRSMHKLLLPVSEKSYGDDKYSYRSEEVQIFNELDLENNDGFADVVAVFFS